ncbi:MULTISPECIES: alpha/beta family hydrolase [Bacillus]|uniref:alpha/beta family hydrolase n=1 Tax=Bacillus TaxID=1386 RepID=UPI0020A1B57B|nr:MULTISPECIES: alpha/beta family hydrolase [Bacillus]MCP1156701.1 alpha/beta hydrolase [Bacillus infantis]MDT0160990.1 alpha/beta hydrolase [Bacillus sp. AG4(2022)]
MTSANKVNHAKISSRLIEQKETADSLAIILPGAGYTAQAPLLHFCTGLFYSKGFDVLHLNYTFNREEQMALSGEGLAEAVRSAIEDALKNKGYDHFYIAAKSIGTMALPYLLKDQSFLDAKAVWLTPLLQKEFILTSMAAGSHKGLCIIGDQDPFFTWERIERIKGNPNLSIKVVEGGDHSLELSGDPIQSIDLLKNIISDIRQFQSF